MQLQIYTIALDSDQDGGFPGLVTRQHGTLQAMEAFVGQFVGSNRRFYSASEYEISLHSPATFLDDQHVEVSGGIYAVVER